MGIFVDEEIKQLKKKETLLNDIAPTVCAIMGLEAPECMSGESLV